MSAQGREQQRGGWGWGWRVARAEQDERRGGRGEKERRIDKGGGKLVPYRGTARYLRCRLYPFLDQHRKSQIRALSAKSPEVAPGNPKSPSDRPTRPEVARASPKSQMAHSHRPFGDRSPELATLTGTVVLLRAIKSSCKYASCLMTP